MRVNGLVAGAFASLFLLMALILTAGVSPADETDARAKIDSTLLAAIDQSKPAHGLAAGGSRVRIPLSNGQATIAIRGTVDDALMQKIRANAGQVITSSPRDNTIIATMPLNRIEAIASDHHVTSVMLPAKPHRLGTDCVSKPRQCPDEQGDFAHNAAYAREHYKTADGRYVDGAGVKIGVISDSIDDGNNPGAYEQALSDGLLDPRLISVILLRDEKGNIVKDNHGNPIKQYGTGTAEGLAMIEIIHRLAPGAQIEFAPSTDFAVSMAQNIRQLKNDGCDIIVDDIEFPDESPFQADIIERAVDDVTSSGVLYFSAAGNFGNKRSGTSSTWRGYFKDGGTATNVKGMPIVESGAHYHAFANGRVWDEVLSNEWNSTSVNLFWNDPLGRATSQYNLYVISGSTGQIYAGTTQMTGHRDPYQSVDLSLWNTQLNPGDKIVIVRGPHAPPRFLHLDTMGAVLKVSTNGSARGHNAASADNAYSIGALSVPLELKPFTAETEMKVERFSSDGPRMLFFSRDGKKLRGGAGNYSSDSAVTIDKPDFTAADGVTTTVVLNGNRLFRGTSAAAPHAAAIAALIKSAHREYAPAQVRLALSKSAIWAPDLPAYDEAAGYGIPMAPGALEPLAPGE